MIQDSYSVLVEKVCVKQILGPPEKKNKNFLDRGLSVCKVVKLLYQFMCMSEIFEKTGEGDAWKNILPVHKTGKKHMSLGYFYV